jgi:two-component system chemotaxis sensor kinase CheA
MLPAEITAFERNYLRRMNRVGVIFSALHLPAFCLIAWINDTGPLLAAVLTSVLLAGPLLAGRVFSNPRHVSMVLAFTAMLLGGLLVHFGQGPVQIEMHFYFFALLAMLAVYANPMVIITAAITVAVHHVAGWAFLPASVFNYAAPFWVVAIHAAFVVGESIATCFIARSFFDNVIGLERIVQARTAALDARNQEMRLVLDNVSQGFLTIDRDGVLSPERSAIVDTWFGPAAPGISFIDYVSQKAPEFARKFAMAWGEVVDSIMPLELTLDQLPKRIQVGNQYFLVEVSSIGGHDPLQRALIVISDETSAVERRRVESDQRDVMAIMERVTKDKAAVLEFFEEAHSLLAVVSDEANQDIVELKRAIHTLKGNAGIFGIQSIAGYCHCLESTIDETHALPRMEDRRALVLAFDRVCKNTQAFLGQETAQRVEIDDEEYESILRELVAGRPHADLIRRLHAWKLEPASRRLARLADQAKGLARRLNKGSITVDVDAGDVRLDPRAWSSFWSSFVHVVRNAVDHGLEEPEDRESAGKPRRGSITLSTRELPDAFEIEIKDDGRGIDWERLRRRAMDLGIPSVTHSDLLEALFADGVTTRDDVSETSGRGVGMGAARKACQDRGGDVVVRSEAGGGTSIVFRFPQRPSDNDVVAIKKSLAS